MRVSLDIGLLARKLKEMGFIEISPRDLAELFVLIVFGLESLGKLRSG